MLKSVELENYMLLHPVTIAKDADLFDAVHLILANKVSGLCVVDDAGKLIGVLSELDCMKGILGATYNQSGVGDVSEYMVSENLDVAKLGDNIVNVAMEMMAKGRRRRPVLDNNGKLVGQITCRQLLAAVKDFVAIDEPSET